MSASDVFLLCLVPSLKRSAGAFGCWRLSVGVQLGCGEEYGGKLDAVPDRVGGPEPSVAVWESRLAPLLFVSLGLREIETLLKRSQRTNSES